MTAESVHTITAAVLDGAGSIPVSVRNGDITLDSSGIPHVQAGLTIAVPDASIIDRLDPRDSRRLVIDVAATLPDGPRKRSFDLGIREASPDRAAGTAALRLASDEALVSDFAQLVDDLTPRSYQSSLRAVCEYVLGRVGGLAPNRAQNPRGVTTDGWAATQPGGIPTFTATASPGMNVGGEGIDTFVRAQSTVASAYMDIRGTAANNVLVAPLGAAISVSAWVRTSTISGPTALVYVQQYDAGGVLLNTTSVAADVVAGQWTRISATVARVPFAVRLVPIFRIFGTVPIGGRVDATGFVTEQTSRVGRYRDYVLAPGTEDADVTAKWDTINLLVNPNVAASVANWTSVNASLTRATAAGVDGTAGYAVATASAANFEVWPEGSTGLANAPAIRAGAWYTFSAYSRMISPTGATTASARIIWWDDAGGIIAGINGPVVPLLGSFQRLAVTGQAPAGAVRASALIRFAGASGNVVHVDAAMLTQGIVAPDWYDGSTPDTADYDFAWTGTANASNSTRTLLVDAPEPEALVWRAGVSAMDFLRPLLMRSGFRLVCDEERRWTIRTANYRAAGSQTYRYGANIKAADETLSREADDWFDAAVYEYVWTGRDGIERRRTDTFALTTPPAKVMHVEVADTPYPGAGRAENIVRRAQGRGRTITATSTPTWDERADQSLSVILEGAPIQTGIANSVRFDLATLEVSATSNTTDTPAGAWVLVPAGERWIDSPVGGTWIGEII